MPQAAIELTDSRCPHCRRPFIAPPDWIPNMPYNVACLCGKMVMVVFGRVNIFTDREG